MAAAPAADRWSTRWGKAVAAMGQGKRQSSWVSWVEALIELSGVFSTSLRMLNVIQFTE
jgi:hypothetical protein